MINASTVSRGISDFRMKIPPKMKVPTMFTRNVHKGNEGNLELYLEVQNRIKEPVIHQQEVHWFFITSPTGENRTAHHKSNPSSINNNTSAISASISNTNSTILCVRVDNSSRVVGWLDCSSILTSSTSISLKLSWWSAVFNSVIFFSSSKV